MILIVDDSRESRFAFRRALERAGFAVDEAETGEQGRAAAAAAGVELIVLDVNLPDVDGFDLCRQLRAAPATAHIPILQVSLAHIGAGARVIGLESGADAYLSDPHPAELIATVRALLRLRAAEDRLRRRVADGERLREITAALSDALTRGEVISVLATTVLTALGAESTELWSLDTQRELVERVHPAPDAPVVAPPAVTAAAEDGVAHFEGSGTGGEAAVATVPLVAYGRQLGALVVGFDIGHDFDEAERDLLVSLGERCGQALERAKLYEEQREIASTLQARLLPARLPSVPGVELGVRYSAGVRDMQVGGDFYDVFSRHGDWIAVVGDVCGRGAEAAALTSLARHTIRAHARHLPEPRAILLALDEAVRGELRDDQASFLTAACARLRLDEGALHAALSVAGHPRPLVIRAATGTVEKVEPTGPLLGILDGIELDETEVVLRPGDALVLYTDGVIEAHVPDGRFGEARLTELLADLPAGTEAQAVADAILRAVGAQDDDVAVLVVALAPDREPTPSGGIPQVVLSAPM